MSVQHYFLKRIPPRLTVAFDMVEEQRRPMAVEDEAAARRLAE